MKNWMDGFPSYRQAANDIKKSETVQNQGTIIELHFCTHNSPLTSKNLLGVF